MNGSSREYRDKLSTAFRRIVTPEECRAKMKAAGYADRTIELWLKKPLCHAEILVGKEALSIRDPR